MVDLFMPFKSVAAQRRQPDGTHVALIDIAPVTVTAAGKADQVIQISLTLTQIQSILAHGKVTARERTVLNIARYSLMAAIK